MKVKRRLCKSKQPTKTTWQRRNGVWLLNSILSSILMQISWWVLPVFQCFYCVLSVWSWLWVSTQHGRQMVESTIIIQTGGMLGKQLLPPLPTQITPLGQWRSAQRQVRFCPVLFFFSSLSFLSLKKDFPPPSSILQDGTTPSCLTDIYNLPRPPCTSAQAPPMITLTAVPASILCQWMD